MKIVSGVTALALAAATGTTTAPEPTYTTSTTRVEVPSVPYCPDNSSYDAASGCAFVDYAEPVGECPHPYKLDKSSGACYATTTGSSSLTCPSGSYLDGKKCVTEVTTPVEISCAKGEIAKDGCVVYAEPVVVSDEYSEVKLSCERGYSLNGDICVKETTTASELACVEGTLVFSKCVTYVTAGKECTRSGYSLVGDKCIQVTVANPSYKCPSGTSTDASGACLSKVTVEPSKVCEKGYNYNTKKDTCEAQVLITAVISADNAKNTSVEVDCRLGTLDDAGNCYQTYTTDAVTVCDQGFDLVGRNCVTQVEVPSEPSCSWGYVLNPAGTECVSTSTLNAQCPTGYINSEEKGVCTKTVRESAAVNCPKGYTLNDKSKCAVLEAVEPSVSCSKGFELIDGQCVIPGYVQAGEDKFYDFTYSCPKGYTLDEEEFVCTDEISSDAVVTCEKGFTLNGKKCTASHTTQAQLMCPKNYVFSSDKSGNLCQRVSYSRPIFRCPEDSTSFGSKCYTYTSTDGVVTTSAGITKSGSLLSNGNLRRI